MSAKVLWKFSDLEQPLPVEVVDLEKNKSMNLKWEAHKVGYQTTVNITVEDLGEQVAEMEIDGGNMNFKICNCIAIHAEDSDAASKYYDKDFTFGRKKRLMTALGLMIF
jgi:hypothetical protein